MKHIIVSIRSWAGSTAPAIALLEAIVAAALLALSCGLFLRLLTDAGAQQARVREQELMIAIVQSQRAQSFVPGLTSGRNLTVSWRKSCRPEIPSPTARLGLLHCELILRGRLLPSVNFRWSRIVTRESLE